jgi:hypothetical protein
MEDDRCHWWWTIGSGGRCDRCGGQVLPGQTIAYNHWGQAVLCEDCAEADGIADQCVESRRLRRARRQRLIEGALF